MDLEWTTLKSVGFSCMRGDWIIGENYRGNYRGKLSGKIANKCVVYPDISKVDIFGVHLPKLYIKQYNILFELTAKIPRYMKYLVFRGTHTKIIIKITQQIVWTHDECTPIFQIFLISWYSHLDLLHTALD